MTRLIGFSLLNAAIALLLLPCAAIAGGTATITASTQTAQPGRTTNTGASETTKITWRDVDTVRMDLDDPSSYMIMRDGKAYTVMDSGGQVQVMDMTGMSAMVEAMASKGGDNPNPFGSIDSVEATGETQTVAGIEGRVYRITLTNRDGRQETKDAVLTDDPLVVEMTQAYMTAISATAGAKAVQIFTDSMPGDDRGLLRTGNDLRVESVSRAEPPASMFELPAKPMTLKEMMSGMGGR